MAMSSPSLPRAGLDLNADCVSYRLHDLDAVEVIRHAGARPGDPRVRMSADDQDDGTGTRAGGVDPSRPRVPVSKLA